MNHEIQGEKLTTKHAKGSVHGYPKYKSSGVEWLGEVPEHWEVVSLRHLFDIKAGGDLKEEFYSEEKTEKHPYPIYTNSIKSNEVYGFSSKPFFKSDTITVTGRGEIGYATYRDHEYDAIIRLLVLTPKKKAPCKYYAYFINSMLNFFGGSTAVSQLSTEQISPYKVFTPPLPEQRAIATFLDRETGRIDTLIGKKKKLVELLKEKRTALISRAVTKGLNASVKLKPSGVEWLGEVPEHWGVKRLKNVVYLKSGDGITVEEIEDDAEYPVYGGNGFRGFTNKYTHDGEFVLIGRQGALCGNINYAHGKFWASEHAVVATPSQPVATFWLGELLRIMNLNQYSLSAAQPGLAIDRIKELFIPLPSFPEQQSIAAFLDRETAMIDTLVSKVDAAIEKLKEYRTALISAAVTGKIDVRKEFAV